RAGAGAEPYHTVERWIQLSCRQSRLDREAPGVVCPAAVRRQRARDGRERGASVHRGDLDVERRGAEVRYRLAPAAEEERAHRAQHAAVDHWPPIWIRPSAKLPRRRSTHARNLHCSPPVAQGRSASWHACFTALLVAASHVLR